MSEAAAAEKAPAPAGGNKLLLLVVLVVNVLIAGGLGYVVLTNQKNNAAAGAAKHEGGEEHEGGAEGEAEGEAAAEAAPEEGHGKKAGNGKFGPLIDIGTFVANLTAPGGASRYAKIGLHVEATSEDAKAKIEIAVVPLRNEALLYLSGLQSDQVIGQERIRVLQEELLKRMSALVGKNVIKKVYFSEFVVQ